MRHIVQWMAHADLRSSRWVLNGIKRFDPGRSGPIERYAKLELDNWTASNLRSMQIDLMAILWRHLATNRNPCSGFSCRFSCTHFLARIEDPRKLLRHFGGSLNSIYSRVSLHFKSWLEQCWVLLSGCTSTYIHNRI